MIMSSEQDFSFNISSNTKLNYIHYPQSYRTTLLQVSLDMHKLFSNTYSTMYRIQIAVQRIPNHIKIILRLISAGSSNMIKRMLPISFNNIVQILNENEIFINQIIDQFRNFFNLLNEIKQLPIKLMKHPSDKTDLIIYNKFNLENGFEKICIIIQQIQKQLKQIVQLIINLDIKTKFHLSVNDNIHHVIPVLYSIEMNAYFLYQFSSIYTDILDRYVLVQTASMGRYVVLSTDEERFETLSNLSKQLSNILQEVDELFIERQNEFETNNIILQEAYEKLCNEFQDRSSLSKMFGIE